MSGPAAAPAVDVRHIVKTFSSKKAVDDLSFTVKRGEILGLIGPNGAGKTSSIRMIMDIVQPDSGTVLLFGEARAPATKRRLGYLPEERGLYRKLKVIDCILFLASLLGMERPAAQRRADELLERTGLAAWRERKVEALSKGMGDVEELCDRVLMVNGGRAILYGDLQEIRSRYGANSVLLDAAGETGKIPVVIESRTRRGHVELILAPDAVPQEILQHLVRRGTVVRHFEAALPSLNEIFLQVVEARHA